MLRTTLVFGPLAGLIALASILIGLMVSHGEGSASSEWFGYLVMIVALSMIFFGVKRYRDRELGGVIKFLPALVLGLSIAIFAGLAYTLAWEVYLASTGYVFMDSYAAAMIESKKAEGVSGPALDAFVDQMRALKESYANPLFRLPMTFMEIFPVGLIIALISAALLRNSKLLPARA